MSQNVYARFSTTEGDFLVQLHADKAPKTVENFVGLAEGTKEFTDPRDGKKKSGPSPLPVTSTNGRPSSSSSDVLTSSCSLCSVTLYSLPVTNSSHERISAARSVGREK